MLSGYRITKKEEVGLHDADFVQIGFYNGFGTGINEIKEIALLCRDRNIRYIIHPINFFLSETRSRERKNTMNILTALARLTDLGLIVHDEWTPYGGRLNSQWEKNYRKGLNELKDICKVSIENANNSHDAEWFWRNFASSITIDIGHLEAAGINSVNKLKNFPSDLLDKLEYIHLHRNGAHRDHWPITEDCKEIKAFEEILKRKPDIKAILEINEMEELEKNLKLLEGFKSKYNY